MKFLFLTTLLLTLTNIFAFDTSKKNGCIDSKKIVAYFSEWRYSNYPISRVDFSKFTHLNYAFGLIDPNTYALTGYQSWILNEVVAAAHNQGVKVLMSVGGWYGSRYFTKMTSSESNMKKFAESCKNLIDTYNVDGIDIDWEYPGRDGACNTPDYANDTDNYLKLLKILREYIGNESLLTAAVSTIPFEKNGQPISNLAPYAEYFDFINVMGYDFAGSWSSVTSHHAGLYDPEAGDILSVSSGVNNWLSRQFPAEKIVIGVPSYGKPSNSYPKGDDEDFMDSDSKRYSSTWKYKNIRKSILKSSYKESTGDWIRVWDSKSSVPFLFNKDTKQFITYDDPYSVSIKADYVLENSLGGMMMWEIEEDTSDSELITAIYEKFIALTCENAKNNKNIVGGGLDIDLDNISIDTGSSSSSSSSSKSTTSRISSTRTVTTSTKTQTINTNCPLYPNYKCCNSCYVSYEDTYKWGILNDDWCSITNDCLSKIKKCWAIAYGYSCCSKCTTTLDTSYNKKWGVENGEWCGIPDSCQ
ncbi:family 18 glycoside hydrolase [Piromyces sp. E2]|nr:family 18 glycoside hydrolase [Piromyces sp. E2]|eukprot:OUM58782.1 family 18 glycoside hydrolase [Piromyces sp. E2]